MRVHARVLQHVIGLCIGRASGLLPLFLKKMWFIIQFYICVPISLVWVPRHSTWGYTQYDLWHSLFATIDGVLIQTRYDFHAWDTPQAALRFSAAVNSTAGRATTQVFFFLLLLLLAFGCKIAPFPVTGFMLAASCLLLDACCLMLAASCLLLDACCLMLAV